ncbi:hypothetical protein DL96DRAFT_1622630 [Flagelloscypha sp. PMI_526]|nr:hypothetical protein DL96DRAFT_1622630 [Flagelloscypha sp. PMI_526]
MSTIPRTLGTSVLYPEVLEIIFVYAAYIVPHDKRHDLRLVAKRFNTLLVPIFNATSLRFEDQEQLAHALAQPNGTHPALYIDASWLRNPDRGLIQELIHASPHARGFAFWSIINVFEQLAALPHLEVFSIRESFDFGIGVDVYTEDGVTQPIFRSLTHLYCEFIETWGDESYDPVDVPIEAFPVLTHVAFNLLTKASVEDAYPEVIFDGADKFLKIPSLERLIFRIDKLPEEDQSLRNNVDFLDECREWLRSANERGQLYMSNPRIVVVRMVYNDPRKEENHFDFLDRLWKMSEESFELL